MTSFTNETPISHTHCNAREPNILFRKIITFYRRELCHNFPFWFNHHDVRFFTTKIDKGVRGKQFNNYHKVLAQVAAHATYSRKLQAPLTNTFEVSAHGSFNSNCFSKCKDWRNLFDANDKLLPNLLSHQMDRLEKEFCILV